VHVCVHACACVRACMCVRMCVHVRVRDRGDEAVQYNGKKRKTMKLSRFGTYARA